MLNVELFDACAPSLSTNIRQCGTVTVCDAIALSADKLTDAFMESGNYRVMGALLHHDIEIKQCAQKVNGLYEFFMANKVNMSKRVQTARANSGELRIFPAILARRYHPVNDEYWEISGGQASGQNWSVVVSSATGVPVDTRLFPVGLRVYIDGKSVGGSATHTAWVVVSVTDNGNQTLTLVVSSQNTASNIDPAKLANPVTGLLTIGTPNVSDYESYCPELPAYLNWSDIPFFVETIRDSTCTSSQYRDWLSLIKEDNALFREYADLPEVEKNRQLMADFQKRFVHTIFWNKPLPNQNTSDFNSLDDILAFDGSDFGVDGATCVGKRANAVGIYEQLADCNRIVDLQGQQLNLPALWKALYNIMRVRKERGAFNGSIDIFTDSVTAHLFNRAMMTYYKNESKDQLRLTLDVSGQPGSLTGPAKKANFGFSYRAYPLFWPQGLTINIVTHEYFDDKLSAAAGVSQEGVARVLWILDLAGIYPGIINTREVTAKTGDLKTLAAVNDSFRCVMAVPTKETTMRSITYTIVVECPAGNLIIENFSDAEPEVETEVGVYPFPLGGGLS